MADYEFIKHVMARASAGSSVAAWQSRLLPRRTTSEIDGAQPNGFSRRQIAEIRKLAQMELKTGGVPARKLYSSRIKRSQVISALRFIEKNSGDSWSHQTCKNNLTGERATFIYRAKTQNQLWLEYSNVIEVVRKKRVFKGEGAVGRHTFLALVKASTRQTKAKTCVSYYLVDANFCLDIFDRLVARQQQLLPTLLSVGKVPEGTSIDFDEILEVSSRMKDAVRFGFFSHTRTKLTIGCDGTASHCTRLGFGDCSNQHNGQCSVCAPAFFGPRKLVKLVDELLSAMIAADPSVHLAVHSHGETPEVYDELVSMKSALAIITARLKYYHSHVLRGRWQQDYTANVIM